MRKRGFDDALKLFAEEQQALRSGAVELATQIGQKKEALLGDLKGLELSREQALRLKEQAEISAKMLSAAINGIRDAQKRLAALESIRAGLSVYTADGDKQTVARANSGLQHKV